MSGGECEDEKKTVDDLGDRERRESMLYTRYGAVSPSSSSTVRQMT